MATAFGFAENDDNAANGGPGGLWSLLAPIDLAEGTYFLGASEFDSIWEDGFLNAGTLFEAGEVGDVLINVNGMNIGSGMAGEAAGFDETIFFSVTVDAVPELSLIHI